MALKAGRVGVAPDQVDEFGQIKSEATSGYTKQEADAKFETQTSAAAALAEKQPINLSVPVELLGASYSQVEPALHALESLTDEEIADFTTTYTKESGYVNKVFKKGHLCVLLCALQSVTAEGYTDLISLPAGYKPSGIVTGAAVTDNNTITGFFINTGGNLQLRAGVESKNVRISVAYYV